MFSYFPLCNHDLRRPVSRTTSRVRETLSRGSVGSRTTRRSACPKSSTIWVSILDNFTFLCLILVVSIFRVPHFRSSLVPVLKSTKKGHLTMSLCKYMTGSLLHTVAHFIIVGPFEWTGTTSPKNNPQCIRTFWTHWLESMSLRSEGLVFVCKWYLV